MVDLPQHLKGRSFTRVNDWTHDDLKLLLGLADELKQLQADGKEHRLLPGRTVGLLFDEPSTRTRVSFAVAMNQLGGGDVTMDAGETQLANGDSIADMAAILSTYLDGVVYRASRQADLDELAREATIPVVNGMTDKTHPCQALSDLMTIRERLGRLSGVRLAYFGAANSVCRSLMRGAAKFGMRFIAATPEGSRPAEEAFEQTRKAAIQQGGTVEFTTDPAQAAARAEVLYTAPWFGAAAAVDSHQPSAEELAPYVLSEETLALAEPDAFVLFSMPGGVESLPLGEEILRGPRSAAAAQAENRLHVQKALLALIVR